MTSGHYSARDRGHPLHACTLRNEEVWTDAPYICPPVFAPRTAAYSIIAPSRNHSWRALRCSQVNAWLFSGPSSLDLLAGAGEDNGRRANGSNLARVINVFG